MRKLLELKKEYNKRKDQIKNRLKSFSNLYRGDYKDIFQELCFCILTANANALSCDKAIKELKEKGLLFKGKEPQIRPILKGKVRFHNKKAFFLVCARSFDIKNKLNNLDIFNAREWLVSNIKGLGYKEASHFLRNIGLGKEVAILDRHILKNLKKYGVINKIPSSLNKKIYLAIENKMKKFSKRIKIPMQELDLLFWSIQTGHIFK